MLIELLQAATGSRRATRVLLHRLDTINRRLLAVEGLLLLIAEGVGMDLKTAVAALAAQADETKAIEAAAGGAFGDTPAAVAQIQAITADLHDSAVKLQAATGGAPAATAPADAPTDAPAAAGPVQIPGTHF